MKNRLLAILLCIMMALSVPAPIGVFADEASEAPDYSDNASINKGNLIKDPDNTAHLGNSIGAGSFAETVSGSHITWQDATITTEDQASFLAGPTRLAYKSNGNLMGHFVDGFSDTNGWTKGDTFVYSIRLKNSAPDKDASPLFGMAFGYYREAEDLGGLVTFNVTNTDEYETYTGYYTSQLESKNHSLSMGFAYPDSVIPYTAKGAQISMDISDGGSLLVAKVAATEITNEVIGADALMRGDTTTVKAEVFNQIGEKDYISQDVSWLVLNGDRTAIADGVTVAPNGDGTATVTAVEEGDYVILAQQGELRKGVNIQVVPPFMEDSEPGEDPLYDVKLTADADTTLGVFDTLSISAELVNSEGETGTNAQQFNWYILNEDRTSKLTNAGINLTPSAGSVSVNVSLDTSVIEGAYYVVAESTAEESLGMLKGLKIIVDKSGTITDIIESLGEDPALLISDMIESYIEILDITEDYAIEADKTELSNILSDGVTAENLEHKEDVQDYFKRAALTALYNIPSESIELFNSDGTHNYEAELAIDKIDDAEIGTTLYAAAFSEMSDVGKDLYKASLMGKDFDTYGDLYRAIKENLLLISIANPKDDGTAYLDVIITEPNLALVGIDADEYFSLSDKDAKTFKKEKLEAKTFTVETLASVLAEAGDVTADETDDNDKKSNNSKRGSGGNTVSFGGSGTAGVTENVETNNGYNQEEIPLGKEFVDVPRTHWACSDIHYLRNIGVIEGTTETTYEPESPVTREQFLKLIMEAFKISAATDASTFADVESDAWYAPYVMGGVEKGIINGKSAEQFGIGEAITRQDACVMMDRILLLSSGITEELSFQDAADISDYAKEAVSALTSYGIVNGIGENTFAPMEFCTRAQAAKIIASAISICNSLGIRR